MKYRFKKAATRLICSRNFIITLVLAAGLSPIYLLPHLFFPEDDLTEQLYPFLLETKRMLSTGTPWWTWQSFLGDNFIGSYAYYTFTRPLLLAVCLLPYKYIGAGLAVSVYLNFLILGWLTSCYLRIMGFDRKLRLIGSLLFTLSNYMLCQLLYCMFFEPVQAFIILLICIERFLCGRRFSLATLTLGAFAVAFVNYYFLPASMIAAAIYFLCRVLCCYRGRWISLTLKAAGCVCLGVLMASVILVPVIFYIKDSTRLGAHEFNDFHFGNNWVLRLLSLVAPMPYEGKLYFCNIDSGWYMNTAYVGIFGVLPYILYAGRHRRSWLTILCAIFIACLATPLNGVFCFFSRVYYSRWCYALILMLLLAAMHYFKGHSGNAMPRRHVLIYSAIVSFFFVSVYFYSVFVRIYKGETSSFDTVWEIYTAALILFVLNMGALLMLTRWPILSRQWTLACVLSISIIAVMQSLHVSLRQSPLSLKKPDMYEVAEKMTLSRSRCDTFTSRCHFEPYADLANLHLNHHITCNRPAITSYISTVNPVTAHLSHVMQQGTFWYVLPGKYPESAVTLLSVKDFYRFADYPFASVPHAALRGERYIPIGMAYDRYSIFNDSISDIRYSETHDILRGMLASLVIDKSDEPELGRYMKPVEFCDTLPFDSLVAARRAYTCDSFKGDTHGFTATISLPDTMAVMFSTAADPAFTATIDGKPSKIYNVNMGMSASIVPAGRHTIRYEFFPPGLRAGAMLSLAAFLIFFILLAGEYHNAHRKSYT